MSERAKLISLAVLFVALIAMAAFQLLRKPKNRALIVAETKSVAAAVAGKVELPPARRLEEIALWLEEPKIGTDAEKIAGRFGLEATPTKPPPDSGPPPIKPMNAPKADGVISVRGELKVIVDGRTYSRGQVVPGTGYRVKDITLRKVSFSDRYGRIAEARLLK